MTKLDLKDAYYTIPVNASHLKFLRFTWKGESFQFTCMPFGLSSAPWAFTKVLKPFAAFFRAKGHRLIVYLDDMLLLEQSYEALLSFTQEAVNLLQNLGFEVNWSKAILTPVQRVEFLGTIIDSRNFSFFLPEDKASHLRKTCKKFLKESNHDQVRFVAL